MASQRDLMQLRLNVAIKNSVFHLAMSEKTEDRQALETLGTLLAEASQAPGSGAQKLDAFFTALEKNDIIIGNPIFDVLREDAKASLEGKHAHPDLSNKQEIPKPKPHWARTAVPAALTGVLAVAGFAHRANFDRSVLTNANSRFSAATAPEDPNDIRHVIHHSKAQHKDDAITLIKQLKHADGTPLLSQQDRDKIDDYVHARDALAIARSNNENNIKETLIYFASLAVVSAMITGLAVAERKINNNDNKAMDAAIDASNNKILQGLQSMYNQVRHDADDFITMQKHNRSFGIVR